MPYIETKITCTNCNYDYGQTYYNDVILDLNIDEILELFDHCQICEKEICDNCSNICQDCEDHFCNKCYDSDISMCQKCKDVKAQCNKCNTWIFMDDLVIGKDDLAICQECKELEE